MKKKNKFVLYTAIFNDYEENLINYNSEEFDCICFTNKNIKNSNWLIKKVNIKKNGSFTNRYYKILLHELFEKYQYSLYIDSNVILTRSPNYFFKKFKKENLVLFQHRKNNLRKELIDIVKYKNIKKNLVMQYEKKFIENKNYFLSENRIIFRNHNNKDVKLLMKIWWKEYNKIRRDQVALVAALDKKKLKFFKVFCYLKHIKYFIVKPHHNDGLKFKLLYYIFFKWIEILIRIYNK
ncbi:hypothetical protein OAT00_03615 [Pelagibacteraceae bacterium]|nr:hypothetical protein [Pelagibacteraceae bacterium]